MAQQTEKHPEHEKEKDKDRGVEKPPEHPDKDRHSHPKPHKTGARG